MTAKDLLESELAGTERAIRHLVGERNASSKIHRAEALERLNLAKLRQLAGPFEKPLRGVPSGSRFADVSSYQPRVDLNAVRHDSSLKMGSLLVVKATEGVTYTDGYLASRWKGMVQAGFPYRGAYHFLHPGISGAEQADYFLRALQAAGGVVGSDILICDVEVSDGQASATVANQTAQFGAVLAKEHPNKRWLYTGGPFAREHGVALSFYNAHWLPAYVGDPRPYYVFGVPIAWQYSDGSYGPSPHVVAGIGPVDCSIVL